jgi:hypothetical protein
MRVAAAETQEQFSRPEEREHPSLLADDWHRQTHSRLRKFSENRSEL